MIAYLHILQERPRSSRLSVHLARHAGLAEKLWQLMAMRSKDAFKCIIE
jgi:hypothetical protein